MVTFGLELRRYSLHATTQVQVLAKSLKNLSKKTDANDGLTILLALTCPATRNA
jgi:hypothetical protein